MTTGSKSAGAIDGTANCSYYQSFPTNSNPSQSSTGAGGRLITKVWSGGDRTVPKDHTKRIKRNYRVAELVRVKTRNGGYRLEERLVTRSFLEYPTRKRSERDVPHPYTCTITDDWRPIAGPYRVSNSWKGGPVNDTWVYTGAFHGVSGISGINFVPPLSWVPNDEIKLIGKLKEAIEGSDFNMAVFLAEGSQALDMITSSAVKIAKAYTLVRKGNVVAASRILASGKPPEKLIKWNKSRDPVANNWLELQYGWLPLLSDMKSGAERLAYHMSVPFQKRYVVRRRIKTSLKAGDGRPDDSQSFSTRLAQIDVQLIAYIKEKGSLPELAGLLDPELVAWELTPFSFVADWVVPIGDYLEARAFASHLGVGSYIRTETKTETVKDWVGLVNPNSNPNYFNVGRTGPKDGGFFRKKVNRTISSTLSVPLPNVKTLDKIASWQHCANAIALLSQVFKSH